jgi:hypothetical protein
MNLKTRPQVILLALTLAVSAEAKNLIANPGFEQRNGDWPAGWAADQWGANSAKFLYPVRGRTGKGAMVIIDDYQWGDAKWYFNDVPVVPGRTYEYRNRYVGTAPSNITFRYTHADGSVSYPGMLLPPISFRWRLAKIRFQVPEDVVSMTVFHSLTSVGSLLIDNVSLREIRK